MDYIDNKPVIMHVQQVLQQKLPNTKVKSVSMSDMKGFVKVELEGGNLLYTDKNAEYAILGVGVHLKTGKFADGVMMGTNSSKGDTE